jgi:hypothetical protein
MGSGKNTLNTDHLGYNGDIMVSMRVLMVIYGDTI